MKVTITNHVSRPQSSYTPGPRLSTVFKVFAAVVFVPQADALQRNLTDRQKISVYTTCLNEVDLFFPLNVDLMGLTAHSHLLSIAECTNAIPDEHYPEMYLPTRPISVERFANLFANIADELSTRASAIRVWIAHLVRTLPTD